MIYCNFCLREFKTLNALRRHGKIKLLCKVKTILCRSCGNKYRNEKSLKVHQKLYCKESLCEIERYVRNWIQGFDYTQFQVSSDSLRNIQLNYVMTIIKRLELELTSDRDKKRIIFILLQLFRTGYLTDADMCKFLISL